MYGRMQEDVAWSRLLDVQREAENRRLYGGREPLAISLMRSVGERIGRLRGRFPLVPRRQAAAAPEPCDAAREVA